MNTTTDILTAADAFALGDLMMALTAHRRVKWTTDGGETIWNGELRQLINGDGDFASLKSGRDVRDAHIWITTSITQMTLSVRTMIEMLQAGGMVFTDNEGNAVIH